MENAVREILELNDVRYARLTEYFNPVIGENSIGDRVELRIPDYELPVQLVPREMMDEPFIKHILKCGSIDAYLCKYFPDDYDSAMEHVHRMLIKIRSKHDFAFWAYTFVRIKPKSGGDDIPFKLNRPQRRLVAKMEEKRRKHSATLGAAINYVIQQPAPEFYLSAQTVKRIINYDAHHRQI